MTIYLDRLNFTNADDIVRRQGKGLLFPDKIVNTGSVDTLDGNDVLMGTNNGGAGDAYGILNTGTINTSNGNDTISGKGNIGIYNTGRIATGTGDDKIFAIAYANGGLRNYGTIDTGTGNDTITATVNNKYSSGLSNYGTIDTGTGNDTISVTNGISNNGTIKTGSGNDTLESYQRGIDNSRFATIDTGDGDDIITGQSSVSLGGSKPYGIRNDGTISTGVGNDIVDALTGGFGGVGYTNLGDGNDQIRGFGSGRFDGGNDTDTLLFGDGVYSVSATKNFDGFYTITKGTTQMLVKNFEFIGSSNDFTSLISFSSLIGSTIDLTKITQIG